MNYASVDQAIRGGQAHKTVPALCRLTLDEIVQGRRELTAVRHPLGFLCLPVYRIDEYGVCVHIWSPRMAQAHTTTSTMHAHSWDLVSFVLYGRVGNTVLRVKDDAAGGTHRIFEIHGHGDVDEIRATARRVRCRAVRHRAAGPGVTYRLPAGKFHTSVLEDGAEAATVVLGRMRAATDLSLGPLDTPTHRIPRQRCSIQETVQAAQIAIDRLAGAAVPRG